MSVSWVQHKGKQILYVDFRGLRDQSVVETIEEEARQIAASPNKVLVLANVEGASIASMEKLKQIGKEGVAPKIARSALVGVTGLKEILLRGYNTFTGSSARSFPNEAAALDWLAE